VTCPEKCGEEDDDEGEEESHPGNAGCAVRGIGARGRADVFGAGKLEVGEFYFFIDNGGGLRSSFWRRGAWAPRESRAGRGSVGLADLVGFDLGLAKAGEVVVDGFFVVESELLGVGANESLVEDAAGEEVEVFFFDGLQHARADFGDTGDVVEREVFGLAGFAEFVAELGHGTET